MRLKISAILPAIKATIVSAKLAIGGAFFAVKVAIDQTPREYADDVCPLTEAPAGVYSQAYVVTGYMDPLSIDYCRGDVALAFA